MHWRLEVKGGDAISNMAPDPIIPRIQAAGRRFPGNPSVSMKRKPSSMASASGNAGEGKEKPRALFRRAVVFAKR